MPNEEKDYRDLPVWKLAMDLAVRVHGECQHIPDEDKGDMCGMLLKAAVQVPARISEGWSSIDDDGFRPFLRRARGAVYRLLTMARLCESIGFNGDWNGLIVAANEVRDELHKLIRATP